jgi:hypothetical protein
MGSESRLSSTSEIGTPESFLASSSGTVTTYSPAFSVVIPSTIADVIDGASYEALTSGLLKSSLCAGA